MHHSFSEGVLASPWIFWSFEQLFFFVNDNDYHLHQEGSMFKSSKKSIAEKIHANAKLMLNHLCSSRCPIWRFHYLGAIHAYIQLAKSLEDTIGQTVISELQSLEQQALSYLDKPYIKSLH